MNGASENLDASSPATVRTWQEFPDEDEVARAINTVLSEDGSLPTPVMVTARERNPQVSTFASEIVTCSLADGSEQRFLCKYGTNHSLGGHGHRGGVSLEAQVYQHILAPLKVGPRYFGMYQTSDDENWIVMEFLDPARRLNKAATDPEPLILAARWAGQFHAANESRLADGLPDLTAYDADYYSGWAERTIEYANTGEDCPPWLKEACDRFPEAFELLLGAPQTVIHGEYYPKNVLIQNNEVYPIDWESAAIGPGEIDIASLTDCWPEDVTNAAVDEYKMARWGGAVPAEFGLRVTAARLYFAFRWLGDRPHWTLHEKYRFRFEQIRCYGRQLGICRETSA